MPLCWPRHVRTRRPSRQSAGSKALKLDRAHATDGPGHTRKPKDIARGFTDSGANSLGGRVKWLPLAGWAMASRRLASGQYQIAMKTG